MKSKKIFRAVFAAVAIAAVFSGCSFLDKDDDDDDTSSQKGRLLFSVDSSARAVNTITPAGFDFANDAGLTFTLTGKISEGTSKTLGSWGDSSSEKAYSRMTADNSILVDTGSWTFRLSVTKDSDEVLFGTLGTKIAAGDNTLDFGTLSEASSTDETRDSSVSVAKGSVSFALSFPAGSGVLGATASLGAIGETASGAAPLEITTSGTTSSVTYSASADAGNYVLAIKLYSNATTLDSTTYLNTYTALVNVAPGCTSAGSAELTDINTLCTVTYEPNGGNLEGIVQTTCNKHAKITLPTPAKTGYDFAGWAISKNGEKKYDGGTEITIAELGENTTLYALWELVTYTITYNFNDENAANPDNAVEAFTIETETFELPTPTTTTENAVFVSWYTTESFESGTRLTQVEQGTVGDIALYAKWFIGNGVDASSAADYISKLTEDSTVTVTGELTEDLLRGIASAIKSGSCKVTLDLSNTTGLAYIGSWMFFSCDNLTNITIPDCVTSIRNDAFHNCTSLTNITIPDSVTSIEFNAFDNCTSLTNIMIPDNVTSIESGAFYKCTSLTSVTIPDGVTSIGQYAFMGCTSLTNIKIPASVTSIEKYAFNDCTSLTGVYITDISAWCNISFCSRYSNSSDYSNPLYYAKKLYLNNVLVENLTIPNSVTGIGQYAFDNCTSITSVTIPDSVTSIGVCAFNGCSSLTEMTIPFVGSSADATEASSSTLFGYLFLSDCAANKQNNYIPQTLKKVTVTGGNILSSAFYGCTSLTNITISDCVTSIGEDAFKGCTSLANITIPNNVTSIENYAFSGCTSLASVTIPDSVTSIGNYAFYGCTSLANITIPGSVTSIGSSAFSDCTSLTNITIPASVTSIGSSAFYNCTSLTGVYITDISAWYNISFGGEYSNPLKYAKKLYLNNELVTDFTIPDGVTSIGSYAFSDCTSITSVTIPGSVTSIESYAFYGCTSLTNITIPNSVTSIESCAFYGCTSLTNITVSADNKSYDSRNTCNAIIETSTNTLVVGCKSTVIPESVTSIGSDAFNGCTSLASITIPDSVTSIGNYAFYGCTSLTNITISDCVTSIGEDAFKGCTSLANITIPNNVTSIENYAFSGCTSLTNITIPDSVTSIGNYAFYGCTSLANITIPGSVTSIGSSAFSDCTSLTNITIPASVTSIESYAFSWCLSLTNIMIPDSVTSIRNNAFSSCTSLTNITIPDSVTSIGNDAFHDCDTLTSVTFNDTETWYYTNYTDYTNGTAISSTDLADTSIAAKYLTSTYDGYLWYKK